MESITNRILLAFLASTSLATVAPAQGTYTAASCNQSAVNAIINGPTHTAVDGDVINVPSGSCTWTTGLNVPSNIGISIIGAGVGSTVITDNYSGYMIEMKPGYGDSLSRISGMTIQPQTGATLSAPIIFVGTCTSNGCPNMRVDDNYFPSTWEQINLSGASVIIADNMFGVLDHNTVDDASGTGQGFVLVNVSHSAWMGVGQYGDNSWASADTFGMAQAIYVENNTFNHYAAATDTDSGDTTSDIGGGRFAVRFNTFTNVSENGAVFNHGTETTGRPRGGRQMESYGNTFTCSNTTQGCPAPTGVRSGTVLAFANSLTPSGGSWINYYVSINAYRTFAGFQPWGYCAGLGPWDSNDGTVYASGTITGVSTANGTLTITDSTKSWAASQWLNNGDPYSIVDMTVNDSTEGQSPTTHPGYEITVSTSNTLGANNYGGDYWNGPQVFSVGHSYQILRTSACIDEPARSGGTLLSGGTPASGSVNQVLDPVYEWADTMTTGSLTHGPIGSDTAKLIGNRDYYNEVSQSAQTSSSSPFNGTVGTGYGTLANRPSTCTKGVGYYATDQGTWNTSSTNFPGQSFSQGQLFVCNATNSWTLSYTPYTYPHPLTQAISPPPPCPTNLQAVAQ